MGRRATTRPARTTAPQGQRTLQVLAARADAAHKAFSEKRRNRQERWDEEDESALAVMNAALSAFYQEAFPEHGDQDVVELEVAYLYSAPRCFRSGYVAEEIMSHLSRAELNASQRARCQIVVVREVQPTRQTRGWKYVGRLAGAVWDPGLATDLLVVAERDPTRSTAVWSVALAARRWRVSRGLPWATDDPATRRLLPLPSRGR